MQNKDKVEDKEDISIKKERARRKNSRRGGYY